MTKRTEVAEEPVQTQVEQPKPQATPPAKQPKELLPVQDASNFANLLDTAKFEHLWRVAQVFAKSKMVPAHYQGHPEDCMIGIQMAMRLDVDPFMFLQKTYVVSGKPGMEAQLAIALVNSRGPFTGPIQWRMEGQGKARECTAYATHKETGEVCTMTVTWAMVEAEGWSKKAGSKWLTMPDLMFRYRSAAFLARLYCPECLMGMMTDNEIIDTIPPEDIQQVQSDGKPHKFRFAHLQPSEPETTDEAPAEVAADAPTDEPAEDDSMAANPEADEPAKTELY